MPNVCVCVCVCVCVWCVCAGEVSSTMEHVLLAPDKKKFEKEVNEISAKIKHLESQRVSNILPVL